MRQAVYPGSTKYLFLPTDHELLASNRPLFKCSYQAGHLGEKEENRLGFGWCQGLRGLWVPWRGQGRPWLLCRMPSCACQTLLNVSGRLGYSFTVPAWCGWNVCNSGLQQICALDFKESCDAFIVHDLVFVKESLPDL